MTLRPMAATVTLALGLLLLTAPATAQTTSNPIPGVDIIVKKNPGGSTLVVGQSGRDGWVSSRVRVERGEYQVSAACPPRRQCPAFRLASVSIDGRALIPNARGEFIFPVGSSTGQVVLRASVLESPASAPR
ncbi:MAG: hypothetical protein K2Y04_13225 [Caulobacteraceae bacterium]|nr:hypothetical protein [Caulobacteraceae bacterium]